MKRIEPYLLLSIQLIITAFLLRSTEVNHINFSEVEVVHSYPSQDGFTQGLLVTPQGDLLEGTGLVGYSSLRRVDLETGEITQQVDIDPELFGEGIALLDGNLVQLTWKSGKGFIYDPVTFQQTGTFDYPHEGWGITSDGHQYYVSDGSSTVHIWDDTLEETGTITVRDSDRHPVAMINELEWIDGFLWANIFTENYIVRIDPESGQIVEYINLGTLSIYDDPNYPHGPPGYLNGIAYHQGHIYVTGKRWPVVYDIVIRSEE